MLNSRSVEIISWTTGIKGELEDHDSYQQRTTDAEISLIRRCIMTKQAANECISSPATSKPKRVETEQFE